MMKRNDYLKLLVEGIHSTTVATIGGRRTPPDPCDRHDAVG